MNTNTPSLLTKRNLVIALCVAVSITILAWFFFISQKKVDAVGPQKRIAIISATMLGEFHKTVVGAFKKRLKSSQKNYTTKVFTPNAVNKVLLASMTEEAVENGFDLIFTVGASAGQVAQSVLRKRNSLIPQVFTGAGDPIKTGLAQTLKNPGKRITGVEIAPGQCIDGVKILLRIKPNMKHLLIPYWLESEVGDLEKDVTTIKDFLAQHGVRVTGVPFSTLNEVLPRLSSFTDDADAITYLDLCLSKDVAPGMVKLCSQNNMTLFACNLDGVRKGAAAGYGSDIENLGYESFAIADHILSQDTPPDTIPIKILSQAHRLGVNKKTMFTQGLTFPAERADLLRDAVIYDTIEDTDD